MLPFTGMSYFLIGDLVGQEFVLCVLERVLAEVPSRECLEIALLWFMEALPGRSVQEQLLFKVQSTMPEFHEISSSKRKLEEETYKTRLGERRKRPKGTGKD